MSDKTAMYFGCWNGEAGHFLGSPSGRRGSLDRQIDFPVKDYILDGGLLPPNLPQTEGRATLVHINGWTIMSFWDRSVDSRYGCNSTFLIKGHLEFDAMVARCKYHFREIWDRFKFPISEFRASKE